MSARLVRAAGVALLPTAALVVVALALPGRAQLALHVWLLVVVAIGLVALLAEIRAGVPATPSPFSAALARPPAAPARPASLAKLEREVSMGVETAFDAHYRLRPLLRQLTAGVLLSHGGVDLAREPERARALVGDELWELVRPDVEAPVERAAAGVSQTALDRAVTDLERLAWS